MAMPEINVKKRIGEGDFFFVFWGQGEGTMPPLVKKLYERMQSEIGKKLCLVTDENIIYWLDIPKDIEKLKSKSYAHYSDYIRVALLERYGGTWLDLTILIGDRFINRLKEVQRKGDFVVAGYALENGYSYTNWFMSVGRSIHNHHVALIRAAIRLWMKDHEQFIVYLHIYYLMEALAMMDESFEKNVYLIDAGQAYKLQHKLLDTEMNEDFIPKIMHENIVSKLNYKINKDKVSTETGIAKIMRSQYI